MALPIHHLPVLQNWDCHVCGTCCKEYVVAVTDEERQRIEAQGWDKDSDLGGQAPFSRFGPFWARRTRINHRSDGSCVFLSDKGRCRIHERFGYETKPLACRLFPFVLVPVADHWEVGMRYACPSAAANKGRPIPEHDAALREFAAKLAEREGLEIQPNGSYTLPPALKGGQRVDWPDTLRIIAALLKLLRDRSDPIERRLRKCLTFAKEMRGARVERVKGGRLGELLDVILPAVDAETPKDPAALPPPGWIGRILFRQALALYLRKDHGPNRGIALQSRTARLLAALRFLRRRGRVPRMHAWLPETTFDQVEAAAGPLSEDAERVLERYYVMKVGSLQFCGAASFGLPLWEGLESLTLTFPILLWTARAFRDVSRAEAVTRALSIVDDHFGFNRILGTMRQRMCFKILTWTGELARLIAWYSR
jgi:lysine-N-methylase